MAFTFEAVDAYATSLPGVTVGTRWNKRTWLVGDRGFAWERPLGKADLARFGDTPAPTGPILGVQTESLDAKDALLAMELPGFFTIPHFDGFPAVLIALSKARAKDVRAAIHDAHRAVAAMPPKRSANKKPKAAAKSPRAKAARAPRRGTKRSRSARTR